MDCCARRDVATVTIRWALNTSKRSVSRNPRNIGTRKMDPALARTALGLNGLTVSGVLKLNEDQEQRGFLR